MLLEIYIWSWINLHHRHLARRLTQLAVMSALILLPLLALNVVMIKRGFVPDRPGPGLEIDLSQAGPAGGC